MAQSIGPYSTATEMLGALRARTISSLELVELHLQRIEQRDGALNAIPVRTADRARDAARAADTALARGQRAALLGLPMTLKESTQTAGLPQSAGMPHSVLPLPVPRERAGVRVHSASGKRTHPHPTSPGVPGEE